MALGIYLTSVFCTICSTEIRTGGGCKNQKSKMMHNEQAATWIKDTLWGFLFADPRGTDINRAFCCSASSKKGQGIKPDKRHLKHANMSLTFQESSDQLFQGRIPFSLLWRFRNHRPHSWPLLATKGPEIYFLQTKLAHVISSCRLLPHTLKWPRPLEKRKDLAGQTADRAVVF